MVNRTMDRRLAVLPLVLLVAGCQASTSVSPSGPSSSAPTASTAPSTTPVVPGGRILFDRIGPGEVEEFFTIDTDGTDERAIFTQESCLCTGWSADGTQVWTMGATGHGTWSFTTMAADGSDRQVISPPIETLNLGPAMPSVDGRWIAFDGWDDTDPSRNGVYLGSPDLTDLHLVTPLPEGTIRTEPFGVTPDGSQVVFFADRGEAEHAEGDLYVVKADGSGLRQLNPPGSTHSFIHVAAGSLSPDGRQAAFTVDDAVYVAHLDGGDARQITKPAGFTWAVSWSPTGDWITYSHQIGSRSVVSLVRPDGTDQKEISATDGSDEAGGGVWSPDGNYLLVRRHAAGGDDLWIMDLEGTYVVQVTHEPSNYGMYAWAPDPTD